MDQLLIDATEHMNKLRALLVDICYEDIFYCTECSEFLRVEEKRDHSCDINCIWPGTYEEFLQHGMSGDWNYVLDRQGNLKGVQVYGKAAFCIIVDSAKGMIEYYRDGLVKVALSLPCEVRDGINEWAECELRRIVRQI